MVRFIVILILPAVLLFGYLLITNKDWSKNKSAVVYLVGVLLVMGAFVGYDEYEKSLRWKRLDEDAARWHEMQDERTLEESVKRDRSASESTSDGGGENVLPSEGNSSVTNYSGARYQRSATSDTDYFEMGYNDGYEDGCHLEKGRLYNKSFRGEAAREYRRGYFEGYPDGRADSDPDDDYIYGRNGADYYDLMDDDDWSEDQDFDDDPDEWEDEEEYIE